MRRGGSKANYDDAVNLEGEDNDDEDTFNELNKQRIDIDENLFGEDDDECMVLDEKSGENRLEIHHEGGLELARLSGSGRGRGSQRNPYYKSNKG